MDSKSLAPPQSQGNAGNYWCKLVAMSPTVQTAFVVPDSFTIGRTPSNNLQVKDIRVSSTHCTIHRQIHDLIIKYILEDRSTNGTFVNGKKVGKGSQVDLKNGDEIMLLKPGQVADQEAIGFLFTIETEQVAKTLEEENKKRVKIDEEYSEEMKCGICLDFMYQTVTTMPCLHSFCGGCFSAWMKKSKNCPTCMKEVAEVKKNPILNNLVEKYLEKYPDKKRSKEEYEYLDKQNVITAESIVLAAKNGEVDAGLNVEPVAPPVVAPPVRRRLLAVNRQPLRYQRDSEYVPSYSSSEESLDVPEESESSVSELSSESENESSYKSLESSDSREEVKGKTCPFCENQTIPSVGEGSKCILCDAEACDACTSKGVLTELNNHKLTSIPNSSLNGNKYEQGILYRHLAHKNITVPKLYSTMVKEIIRKKYTYKNLKDEDVQLYHDSVVCENCVETIWMDFLYKYRLVIQSQLPAEERNRKNCKYGKACKSQQDPTHNKIFNHVI